jgi:hypothetical protein
MCSPVLGEFWTSRFSLVKTCLKQPPFTFLTLSLLQYTSLSSSTLLILFHLMNPWLQSCNSHFIGYHLHFLDFCYWVSFILLKNTQKNQVHPLFWLGYWYILSEGSFKLRFGGETWWELYPWWTHTPVHVCAWMRCLQLILVLRVVETWFCRGVQWRESS